MNLQVGDIVCVEGRGKLPFIVLSLTEHTVRIKEWPVLDAPPAEEVLRSEILLTHNDGGDASTDSDSSSGASRGVPAHEGEAVSTDTASALGGSNE